LYAGSGVGCGVRRGVCCSAGLYVISGGGRGVGSGFGTWLCVCVSSDVGSGVGLRVGGTGVG